MNGDHQLVAKEVRAESAAPKDPAAISEPSSCFQIRIVNEAGAGIAGVPVKVWYPSGLRGAIPWSPDRTETDADGWAHFAAPSLFKQMPAGYPTLDVIVGDTTLAAYVAVMDGEALVYTAAEPGATGSRQCAA